MSSVRASSAEVRKLASALKRYKEESKQAKKRVESAIRAANWHDKKIEQFEARYKDYSRQVDRFMAGQVDEMLKSLNELARRLEEIERMRM